MSTEEALFPRIALLVVDVQPAFLKVIPNAEELLKRIRFSLSVAKLLGFPVLFTEQVPDKLGGTDESLIALAPGAPRLAKKSFAATGAEGFDSWVAGHGIEHYLIAGIETTICVYQTAISLIRDDQEVTLLTDCVGARRADDARAALNFLSQSSACLPSESVFYSLLESAEHPLFRDYTRLVIDHG